MPPCLDIFVLPESRTRQVLDRFVEQFVAAEFKRSRVGAQVDTIPAGTKQHPEGLGPDDYEWLPAETVEQVVALALAEPPRGFWTSLETSDPQLYMVTIGCTVEGQLVLGLSIDHEPETDQNLKFAKSRALELAREYNAHTAYVGCEFSSPVWSSEVPSRGGRWLIYWWGRAELCIRSRTAMLSRS